MARLLFILIVMFLSKALSYDFPIIENFQESQEILNSSNIDVVFKAIASSKVSPQLKCSLRIEKRNELKKFSTGEKYVETIEVFFRDDQYGGDPSHAFFPTGSKLIRRNINSSFGGLVEEIRLFSNDRVENSLVVHHDGQGHLVWASMENVLRSRPCLLNP